MQVKGGGHNPNVGFSSTNWGVLITFSKDAATTLSADHSEADVGPGARWGQVIGNLTAYNVAVVGGRLGWSILPDCSFAHFDIFQAMLAQPVYFLAVA
jgi:hypothetical protein